jgi:hypothetical protein
MRKMSQDRCLLVQRPGILLDDQKPSWSSI